MSDTVTVPRTKLLRWALMVRGPMIALPPHLDRLQGEMQAVLDSSEALPVTDTVSELKACPFCGGDEHISILWDNEWGSTAHAHCTGCSACGPLSHATSTNTTATSGAIAAWNRRTPDWQHDEAWHKDYEGRLLADAQRTSEELIEMRALAQELATALGKFVGYALSGDVYYFSPETHDLLARARKAKLDV